jgi:translation elongation factor EF-Tu-like GTPase
MNNNLIIVKARIKMKTAQEGGRTTGFFSGYRPIHVFEPPKDGQLIVGHGGDIRFEGRELIEPGETAEVIVRFLRTPTVVKYVNVGQKWLICEGARPLGFGEILEVINP